MLRPIVAPAQAGATVGLRSDVGTGGSRPPLARGATSYFGW